jgi:hypothetical protein
MYYLLHIPTGLYLNVYWFGLVLSNRADTYSKKSATFYLNTSIKEVGTARIEAFGKIPIEIHPSEFLLIRQTKRNKIV